MEWEDLQLKSAKATFYNEEKARLAQMKQKSQSRSKKSRRRDEREEEEDDEEMGDPTQEEYDLLFENEIEFIAAGKIEGENMEEKMEEMKQTKKEVEQENIKQTRMSLPIFAHREALLDAIDEFQVLVIVGEVCFFSFSSFFFFFFLLYFFISLFFVSLFNFICSSLIFFFLVIYCLVYLFFFFKNLYFSLQLQQILTSLQTDRIRKINPSSPIFERSWYHWPWEDAWMYSA